MSETVIVVTFYVVLAVSLVTLIVLCYRSATPNHWHAVPNSHTPSHQRRNPLVGSGRRSTTQPNTHWAYSDGSFGRYDHKGRFIEVTKEFYNNLSAN